MQFHGSRWWWSVHGDSNQEEDIISFTVRHSGVSSRLWGRRPLFCWHVESPPPSAPLSLFSGPMDGALGGWLELRAISVAGDSLSCCVFTAHGPCPHSNQIADQKTSSGTEKWGWGGIDEGCFVCARPGLTTQLHKSSQIWIYNYILLKLLCLLNREAFCPSFAWFDNWKADSQIKALIQMCARTTCVLCTLNGPKEIRAVVIRKGSMPTEQKFQPKKKETVSFQVNEISSRISRWLPFQHKCRQNYHNVDQCPSFDDWCLCKAHI